MSEDRSKSAWPWIVGLLLALPTLYIASFGPACRFGQRGMISARAVKMAYRPILAAMDEGPEPVERMLRSYAGFSTGEIDALVFHIQLIMSDP
jgi:hypothetical protein